MRLAVVLGSTAALVLATASVVDLTPKVDASFFFASGDPALRVQERIERRFGVSEQILVLASSPEVTSADHWDRIEHLTLAIEAIDGVRGVRSLARGPDDLADAQQSPLWRRLLLAGDGSTSYLVAEVREARASSVVAALEAIVARHEHPAFELQLAGIPYTVEVMRRALVRDFTVFSIAAVLAFGAAILLIFRSGWILAGTLVTCTSAVTATLLVLHGFGLGIGLLTANLTTIVFVLAQSHVVFMASNWQALARESAATGADLAAEARRQTLRASLGSCATTLLGFLSLLFVPARPLQELGAGGSIGAVVALAAAYLVLPIFLERARPKAGRAGDADAAPISGRRAAILATACAIAAVGLPRLDTDPSLLAYFDADGPVHAALAKLDRTGGSSPLSLVVHRRDGERLDTDASYERLWELQRALEAEPTVGRVISLPVLLAEAKRRPLVWLLSDDWILDLMGPQTTGRFLTADRREALFLLQMDEGERSRRRSEEIERLRGIARERGFEVPMAGAIYALQGRLADLVAQSLVLSLAALVVLFACVAAFAAGSVRVGLAASAATALVPLATLGGFGAFGVPLDVIAAPAASVGLGLAADATLHLISAWRRRSGDAPAARWRRARAEQRDGVLRATGIVVLGFGLFALSSFPPTRRFGVGVAVATAIGALVALWLLPALASWWEKRARPAATRSGA